MNGSWPYDYAACRRVDMTAPLMIFGGLFIIAIVACGTLEARTPALTEEPRVARHENVIGPVDMSLIEDCGRSSREHCRKPSAIQPVSVTIVH